MMGGGGVQDGGTLSRDDLCKNDGAAGVLGT